MYRSFLRIVLLINRDRSARKKERGREGTKSNETLIDEIENKKIRKVKQKEEKREFRVIKCIDVWNFLWLFVNIVGKCIYIVYNIYWLFVQFRPIFVRNSFRGRFNATLFDFNPLKRSSIRNQSSFGRR